MKNFVYIFSVSLLFIACSQKAKFHNVDDESPDEDLYIENSSGIEYENEDDNGDGRFEDGTYSATVDYYNPSTGYSATYTLDVEVEDNEVVKIYFPNDGYLDDDYISPSELDEYGETVIYGYDGRTYEIKIDY